MKDDGEARQDIGDCGRETEGEGKGGSRKNKRFGRSVGRLSNWSGGEKKVKGAKGRGDMIRIYFERGGAVPEPDRWDPLSQRCCY